MSTSFTDLKMISLSLFGNINESMNDNEVLDLGSLNKVLVLHSLLKLKLILLIK